MRKILVRRLGVASVAKFVGTAHAIWAFIVGFLVLFGGIAAVVEQDGWNVWEKFGGSLAVVIFSVVVFPLIAFLLGWLYGAVLALVANLFLHTAKGIELDVEDEK